MERLTGMGLPSCLAFHIFTLPGVLQQIRCVSISNTPSFTLKERVRLSERETNPIRTTGLSVPGRVHLLPHKWILEAAMGWTSSNTQEEVQVLGVADSRPELAR